MSSIESVYVTGLDGRGFSKYAMLMKVKLILKNPKVFKFGKKGLL